jgi:hypothetical protein
MTVSLLFYIIIINTYIYKYDIFLIYIKDFSLLKKKKIKKNLFILTEYIHPLTIIIVKKGIIS